MSANAISRWRDGLLEPLDDADLTAAAVLVADSWLVAEGTALALGLHRARFLDAVGASMDASVDAEAFWDAAIAAIPREGDWFPRVELQERSGAPQLVFRLRPAPQRGRSLVLASASGPDPRRSPAVKGPDGEALQRLHAQAQRQGADEAVILTPEGYVVEGASTALLWWHGKVLTGPLAEFARVDSVTARSVIALATALGLDVHEEPATPPELDGLEIWAVNALHGIRIVTGWVDGPAPAEQPGRLAAWRARLDRLRRPLS